MFPINCKPVRVNVQDHTPIATNILTEAYYEAADDDLDPITQT